MEWIAPNDTIALQQGSKSKEGSIVLMKEPWVTHPMDFSVDYISNQYNYVDLNTQRTFVRKTLLGNNEKQYVEFCKEQNCPVTGYIENIYNCFQGAEYVSWLFKGADPLLIKSKNNLQPMALEQVAYLYGVYHFNMDIIFEGHGFVLDIQEKDITVYNTYGGTREFFITTFPRKDWIESFLAFNSIDKEDQYKNYHKLWGFRRAMTFEVLPQPIIKLKFSRLVAYKIY